MADEKINEVNENKVENKDTLITRVSQVKTEAPEKSAEESKFNINELDAEIEKVSDGNIKGQLLALKKSLISGENQKYQEIAKLRKEYENKLSGTSNWTTEKVQALLNDPTFVKAAQDIAGTQTNQEETSMLSDAEKNQFKKLSDEIQTLRGQSWKASQQQQDEANKSKYANYDSQAVDIITADLLAGKVQATREDLWKVHDYENAVKRAYELGKQDRISETGEKIQLTSIGGLNMTNTDSGLKPEKGESNSAFWRRIADHNMKKFLREETKKE